MRMGRAGIRILLIVGFAAPAFGQGVAGDAALTADRPEVVIFALMRQLTETPVGDVRVAMRRQMQQLRGHAHDGAIRVGTTWVPARELRRRRERYVAVVAEAEELLGRIGPREPRDRAEQAERARIRRQVGQLLAQAARTWGDPLIRSFLSGQVSLMQEDYLGAERLFAACIRAQPLVAGFYQGRAEALASMDRPLDALADWVTVSHLRPDDPLALEGFEAALQAVPGTMIRTQAFVQARQRYEAIEDADARRPARRSRRHGPRWMMPGEDWQGREHSLPVPPYDTLFARRAVAVPVAAEGVLLADGEALEGALELFLELAPGKVVPAEVVELRRSVVRELQLPLAAVRVEGLTFEPVAPLEGDRSNGDEASGRLKPGDGVTVKAIGRPAGLGPASLRRFAAKVTELGVGAPPALDQALLPGEAAAPVFDDGGRLVTFLLGRTDVQEESGGPARVLRPADVAEYAAAAARVRPRRSRGPAPRGESRSSPVEGRAFILHILVGAGE